MIVLRKSQVRNFIKTNEVSVIEKCGCCATVINYSISRGRLIEHSFFTWEGTMEPGVNIVAKIRK